MEKLEAPDGTIRSFRPRLANLYKSQGWKPVKAKGSKSTGRKAKTGNVDADTTTETQEN